jgi:hypothetical protein
MQSKTKIHTAAAIIDPGLNLSETVFVKFPSVNH